MGRLKPANYRRRASARAASCTVAVTTISAGTSVMVMAASNGALGWPAVVGSVACVAVGFLLLFLGDCRELRPN